MLLTETLFSGTNSLISLQERNLNFSVFLLNSIYSKSSVKLIEQAMFSYGYTAE